MRRRAPHFPSDFASLIKGFDLVIVVTFIDRRSTQEFGYKS